MKLVTITTYSSREEAELEKNLLKGKGVESIVKMDDAGGARPNVGWGTGGAKLMVSDLDVGKAREIIQAGGKLPKEDPSSKKEVLSVRSKWVIAGWITGSILAVANFFFMGFLGAAFYLLFDALVRVFGFGRTACSGEGCWWLLILTGSFGYFLVTPLFFSWIGRIKNRTVAKSLFIVLVILFVALSVIAFGL